MMTLSQLLPQTTLPQALQQCQVSGLTLDSRALEAGNAFVAIPGDAADGRRFIANALNASASCVLAEAQGLEQHNEKIVAIEQLKSQLGDIAARFYGTQQADNLLVGVTGTNGKSSVAWFLRAALNALGKHCAMIGTLGMQFGDVAVENGRTTPDVITLHRTLAAFRQAGADSCVMEVSSHALVQGRADGVPISVAIFTNLSRDHLDYHGTMQQYFAAKQQLFMRPELLVAVINTDDEHGRQLLNRLPAHVKAVTFGSDQNASVRVIASQTTANGIAMSVALPSGEMALQLPLFGEFNVSNVLAVIATLYGLHYALADIERAVQILVPVPGRMQLVGNASANLPCVLVDFAHTPDAVEKALLAVKQHFMSDVWCVIGCGGNRDQGKRPLMAAAAERLSQHLVLTSDNPRNEDPLAIIEQMQAGLAKAEQAYVQVDRAQAISYAIQQAAANDVVVICGKGHETTQEINGQFHPLDDRELAQQALVRRWAMASTEGGADNAIA